MKSIEQRVLLNDLEKCAERHLQIAIHDFQNMSAEELLTPGNNGGWSIAQCLEHLNRYGKYYLPSIKRAVDQKSAKSSSGQFKSGWFGNYFTRMMNPETGKRKIKAFKSYSPPPTLDAHAVVAEFIEQQETLLTYLRLAVNSDLNGIRIPISIAKWLRLKFGDVLQFVIAHNERHVQQALRVSLRAPHPLAS
jgi:hypothetical protein